MIVDRYLCKEVLQALFGVTLVLLLIFLCQQVVHYLSYAASGKIAPHVLVQMIGFMIPWLLAFLLPLGLYFAILLTYSRLYADNELRIMHASGFSIARLLGVTISLAVAVAILVTFLMFIVNPLIATERQAALTNGSFDTLIETLIPGRFKVMQDGQRVVYVENINRSGQRANNIFMAEQMSNDLSEPKSWSVISADKAYVLRDSATDTRWIVAENGYRYKGVPGQQNFQIIQFGSYHVRVPDLSHLDTQRITEAIPTGELLHTYDDPEHAAEFQWRCAIPLSVIFLAVLAFIFSRVGPRQGRYAMILPGMVFYIVYMNLLFVARHFVEQKSVTVYFGMWWVHGLFLAFLLFGIMWRMRKI